MDIGRVVVARTQAEIVMIVTVWKSLEQQRDHELQLFCP